MYNFQTFKLSRGNHPRPDDGLCVMEAASFLAGEIHSDRPRCVSSVIAPLAIMANDCANDALRQELLADLPWRLVGTRLVDPNANAEMDATERRRARMAIEWCQQLGANPSQAIHEFKQRRYGLAAECVRGSVMGRFYGRNYHDLNLIAQRQDTPQIAAMVRSCVALIDRMIRLTEPQETARGTLSPRRPQAQVSTCSLQNEQEERQ